MLVTVTVTAVCSDNYFHCHPEMFIAHYGHCHWSVQCSVWSLSLCRCQCSLRWLSLCSLPPHCSYNVSPKSSYRIASKKFSRQSLLPFQQIAVPKVLQLILTVIKPLPSWHPRCCSLSPELSPNVHSHSIIFTGISADQSTYIMLYNVRL